MLSIEAGTTTVKTVSVNGASQLTAKIPSPVQPWKYIESQTTASPVSPQLVSQSIVAASFGMRTKQHPVAPSRISAEKPKVSLPSLRRVIFAVVAVIPSPQKCTNIVASAAASSFAFSNLISFFAASGMPKITILLLTTLITISAALERVNCTLEPSQPASTPSAKSLHVNSTASVQVCLSKILNLYVPAARFLNSIVSFTIASA